jgi:hypothetical protein
MSMVYRGIVVVTFGLVLMGAAPKSNNSQLHNQAEVQNASQGNVERIASALEKLSQRPVDSGCKLGEDDRYSDLCAQWKAADAAAESAYWTWATFLAGIVGLCIGTGTLIFAARAAYWAKEAAIETKRGAAASEMAVEETRRIGEAQVRCYISITEVILHVDALGKPRVDISVLNSGQSPALKFRWAHHIWYQTEEPKSVWDGKAHSLPDEDAGIDICSGPCRPPDAPWSNEDKPFDVAILKVAPIVTAKVTIIMTWEDIFGNSFTQDWKFFGGKRNPVLGSHIILTAGIQKRLD